MEAEIRRLVVFCLVIGGVIVGSVSRHKKRLTWGVPVPDSDEHVMYVWLDALTNYITAIGYPDRNAPLFKKFWPADYHVIGKDITRFHTVYWPAFLMSAGVELPKAVWAHGFINVQGEKMSKSIGNVLSPDGLVETYGLDQIRYFLMREIPHGQDGNFSHEQAIARINADLANALGNLAQRTLSFIYKNCDAKIPEPGNLTTSDKDFHLFIYGDLMKEIRESADAFKFHDVLNKIWSVVYAANGYIDTEAPWTLKKTDPERMKTVLYVLSEVIRCLAILIQPVTPAAGKKMLDQLQIPSDQRDFSFVSAKHTLKGGEAINQPEGVFPRIVEEAAA
jgi:methionyl-tRNA synthetase